MLLCVYFIYILDRFLHQNNLIHNYDGQDKKSTHENINVILKWAEGKTNSSEVSDYHRK